MTHRAPQDKPLRSIPQVLLCALLAGCSAPRPTSFLVISMDTFRADRLGARDADGGPLTPALDEMASESLVFTRAFAQANETLYSHAALFTGRFPSEIAPLDYRRFRLTPDSVTLAACLDLEGYRTEAVVAGGHLAPQFGLGAGFQRYLAMDDFSSFQQTEPVAVARLEELAAADAPFLLFVHGYDNHSPYVKPGLLFRLGDPDYDGIMLEASRNPLTYERIFGDRYFPDFNPSQVIAAAGDHFVSPFSFDELEDLAATDPVAGIPLARADLDFLLHTYDAAARHADFFVGLLLDALEEYGLADDTVVVVLADHGEDLLDHGHFNHRFSLHDSNVHVPLLLRIPGEPSERIESAVGLVDVVPTILALAGARPRDTHGRSLLDPLPGRAIFSESMRGDLSVRDEEARLIVKAADSKAWRSDVAPPGAWLGDDAGRPLAWADPRREVLGRLLAEIDR